MNLTAERKIIGGGVTAVALFAASLVAGFFAPEHLRAGLAGGFGLVAIGVLVFTHVLIRRAAVEARATVLRMQQEKSLADELRGRFFDASGDAIFVLTESGGLVLVNSAAWLILQEFGVDLVTGMWWEQVWSGEEKREADVAFATARSGGIGMFEVLRYTQQGRTVALEVTMAAMPDSAGRCSQILAVARDVSELRSVEEKFRVMFENSSSAHFIFDGAKIVDCNHAAVEMLQFRTKLELLECSVDHLSAPLQDDGSYSSVKREELWELAHAMGHFRYEWIAVRQDGEELPVEVALTPIILQGKGMLMASWTDLSGRRNAERALKDSEQRFLAFTNHSPTLCFIKDDQGRMLFINQVMADAFDTSMDEMVGKNDFDWLPLESARAVMEYDRRILETNKAAQQIEMITTGEGREYEWLVVKFPIVTPERRMLGGIGVDIREQRRAERALKQSEAQFRDLFDDAPVAYHELGIDGRITRVNKTEQALLGYTESEMVGHPVWDFIVESEVRKSLGEKLSGRAHLGEGYQCTFLKKDGSFVPALVTERLMSGGGGEIAGLRCTMQDISALKRAEREIRAAEEQYRKIFENAIEGIFQTTPDGRYLAANPALAHIHGYASAEELMHDVQNIGAQIYVNPDRRRQFCELMERNGAVSDFESQVYRRSGSIIWISEHARAVRGDDGRILYYEGAIEDVTAKKEAAQAMAKARDAAIESARLKSEFLANMSHEIRTPMNGIIGMTGLLLDMEMSQRQRDFTQTIADSAEALLKIINDILDFSKIEAGMMTFEEIDFDLHEVVEGVVDLFAGRSLEKHLEIAAIVTPQFTGGLRGDPGRLRQVLANLVGNAVKFTESGHVLVQVEIVELAGSEVMLRFNVSDSGIGISDDQVAKLFQAFVQADGSTTRRYGGTGLGLAISKRMITQMGGEIGVRSYPNQGSTFWFTARFRCVPEVEGSIADRQPFKGVRALIVDDCEPTRKSVAHLLRNWGVVTASATTGAAALDALNTMSNEGGHFDFVVLDLHPGDMDGIDVARAINADPRFSESHIIALTLLDDSENVSTLKDAGIAAQIFKPVKRGALRMAVEKLLMSEASRDVREGLTELQEVKSVPQGGPRLRILVGEDSPVNQKVVSHQLQALGHLVDIFGDGEAVLAAAERTPYEVILMDCQMPGIDGYEATRQIRKIEAGSQRRAWVVAMTANAMKGDRDRCIEAGMDDYISKPVRSEDLAAALRRYLEMREHSESGSAWKGVLDSEALDGFRELEAESGQSVLAGLVGIFLDNSPSVIDAARNAIAAENLSLLAREAHMLKGSCSNFGASRMRLACERLETAARNGELGTVAGLLADVEREYEYVRVALEHEMGGVGA